jgi:hypothetical protein
MFVGRSSYVWGSYLTPRASVNMVVEKLSQSDHPFPVCQTSLELRSSENSKFRVGAKFTDYEIMGSIPTCLWV